MPYDRTEHSITLPMHADFGCLTCPRCGSDNTHILLVRLVARSEDQTPKWLCSLKAPKGPVALTTPTARTTKTKVLNPPADPGTCCTNSESTTFPPDAGIKYGQTLQYGTERWHQLYSTARNTIEGFNAFIKDSAHEDLANPGRRRIRGYARQLLIVAVSVAAANIRKIRTFFVETQAPGHEPKTARTRRSRRPETVFTAKAKTDTPGKVEPDLPA